jgi:nitrite reductase (NADH) large subunit
LVLAGLLLSARKRITRFRIGSYSGWRVLHGTFGVGGLVALVAHTGFRIGDNLNMALMVAFLVSAATGAVAGVSTGLAPSTSESTARRIAGALRSAHDYAFWPLGVLLVFHVIKVYYY